MIALCTGKPTAHGDADGVVVSFPSGKDTVEVSLSLADSQRLYRAVMEASVAGFKAIVAGVPTAEVVAFPKRKPRPKRLRFPMPDKAQAK